VDVGVFIFPTDQTIQPVELGQAVEQLGYESLWFAEHSHIPTSRITPWGGRKDAPPLPEYYWRTHDQFVALAAIAATTTTLKLGTGICLLAQRDPIWTAKEVASLDTISGGRFIFGVGYGWNVEEYEEHGLVFSQRRDKLRESVLAMKELWTRDEASYRGQHVSFSPSWAWPKPTQKPHPPIVLGGSAGPKTAAHIAEFCDGWMPIGASNLKGLDLVHDACRSIGRDPETLELGVFRARADARTLDELQESGVKRALLELPHGPREEVLRALEDMASLVNR